MSAPSARSGSVVLAALGDLVDDIVVRLDEPIHAASDTRAHIDRRQGGSAANVAAIAAQLGSPARFLGQVGDDAVGRVLVSHLSTGGVDTEHVRYQGRTGTIIVLVDHDGERTMLTDRRACLELSNPEPAWLGGVDVIHIPLYSFTSPPLSTTATTVIAWAHERNVAVSLDVSSVTVIDRLGVSAVHELLDQLAPAVVFANADEARVLEIDRSIAGAITVVKRGADPVTVFVPEGDPLDVPAMEVRRGADSTGAGDAFAAGFLTFRDGSPALDGRPDGGPGWIDDPAAACRAGHLAAAQLLSGRVASADDVITHADGES